jgi:hypothetical protein
MLNFFGCEVAYLNENKFQCSDICHLFTFERVLIYSKRDVVIVEKKCRDIEKDVAISLFYIYTVHTHIYIYIYKESNYLLTSSQTTLTSSSTTLTLTSQIKKEYFVKQKSLHHVYARCTRSKLAILQH